MATVNLSAPMSPGNTPSASADRVQQYYDEQQLGSQEELELRLRRNPDQSLETTLLCMSRTKTR